MKLQFTTLDSFTTIRYQGNPVAIVQVPGSQKSALTQAQKQTIAKEFNLSEIVFLHLPAEGTSPSERNIDIFTSHAEVPFAGHPTIGTSHFLLHETGQKDVVAVTTKAGRIPISKDELTGGVIAEIPHYFHLHSGTFKSPLNEGVENPVCSIVNGMSFIYCLLPSLEVLAQACENLNRNTYDPSALDPGWQNGLIGTMYFVPQGTDTFGRKKYRTRMFGSREDPGTGSASSGLACFLALQEKEGGKGPFKFAFTQGVEMGRQNDISVEVTKTEDEKGIEKVVLGGNAVKVMEGTLEV